VKGDRECEVQAMSVNSVLHCQPLKRNRLSEALRRTRIRGGFPQARPPT
jgi:hypothetical protein